MMQLDGLRLDPIARMYPQRKLYAFAGRGSVGIIPNSVLGIGPFWFPPLSGKEFGCLCRLRLPALDAELGDSGRREHYAPPQLMLQAVEWLPWCIRRQGLFNYRVGGKLVVLEVRSELCTPADADGFVMRIELTLRSPAALEVEVQPRITDPTHAFGACADTAWNYEPPSARGIVWSEGRKVWRTDGYYLRFAGEGEDVRATDAGWSLRLRRDQTQVLLLGASLEGKGLEPMTRALAAHARSAERYWREHWKTFIAKTGPALAELPPARQLLAARSWATVVTCRWDRPGFLARPHYATEGIDGGAICAYLWDLAYTSRFVALLEGKGLRPLVQRYLSVDVQRFFTGYALSPSSADWLGVFYAYNLYALVRIVSDYVDQTGDTVLLAKPFHGRSAIEHMEAITAEYHRRFLGQSGVLEFAHNRYLLELHTSGYEGLVPNPALDHVWVLRTLNRLRELAGLPRRAAHQRRAQQMLAACRRRFWNGKAGWFFPAGQRREAGIWSIQVLSALRLGVFSDREARALAAHLRDGRFLGSAGLYSIAADDRQHFTLIDPDWGGSGCFTGHVGIVIEGLRHHGLHEQAEELLDRITWWGTHVPYIPQSARADCMNAFEDRPNAVAGGAIAQALLMGSGV